MSDLTTPQPTGTPHTGWCVQDYCTDGAHRGRPTTIGAEPGSGFDELTLQLVQPQGAPVPFFSINDLHLISVDQAREVVYVLRREAYKVHPRRLRLNQSGGDR